MGSSWLWVATSIIVFLNVHSFTLSSECICLCLLIRTVMNPHRRSFPLQWIVLHTETRTWSQCREHMSVECHPHGRCLGHTPFFQGSGDITNDESQGSRRPGVFRTDSAVVLGTSQQLWGYLQKSIQGLARQYSSANGGGAHTPLLPQPKSLIIDSGWLQREG